MRATLCFVIRDGQALLIEKKRGLGRGKVNAPGGRIEPGETAVQCAVREVGEEVLVTPTDLTAGGQLQFQFTDGLSLHCQVFRAAGCVGEPRPTDEADPFWCDLDRIPYHRMWADDGIWLPHMLAGRKFLGRFLFDGDAMLGYDLGISRDWKNGWPDFQ